MIEDGNTVLDEIELAHEIDTLEAQLAEESGCGLGVSICRRDPEDLWPSTNARIWCVTLRDERRTADGYGDSIREAFEHAQKQLWRLPR